MQPQVQKDIVCEKKSTSVNFFEVGKCQSESHTRFVQPLPPSLFRRGWAVITWLMPNKVVGHAMTLWDGGGDVFM